MSKARIDVQDNGSDLTIEHLLNMDLGVGSPKIKYNESLALNEN